MSNTQPPEQRWIDYRASSKHGPLTAVAIQRLRKRLERLGELSGAAVDHSIAQGWAGVYAPGGTMTEREQTEMAQDNSRLAAVMRTWAEIHTNVRVTPNMVKAYREALVGMTPEQFERAVTFLNRTAKWFPKPEAIWQAARSEGWL